MFLGLLFWILPFAAFAQGVETPSPLGGEDLGEETDPVAEPDEGLGAEPVEGDEQGMAEEGEDKEKHRKVSLPLERKAKVVEKKIYPKLFKHELNLFFGVNPADSFVVAIGEGGRYGFHFHEMLGVQIYGGAMHSFDREDTKLLTDSENEGGLGIQPDFIKNAEVNWFVGGDFVFYPFYGKFSLFSAVIAHYDAGIYVGCAGMGLENDVISPAPDVGVLANFYILKWLSVRFDFTYFALITEDKRRRITGGDERGGTLLRNIYFITFGPSFHFPVD